jgi:signal transduction histidine kinase
MFSHRRELQSQVISDYRITKPQAILALIAVLSITVLGISSISELRTADYRSKILSDIETPAASIIFTQRETLVYATKLALWSNGGTSRRNVQIARNLLAQRLSVVDSSGRSMGSRANKGYWDALKKSDQLVDAAPQGVLPENLHRAMNPVLLPVIDQILQEARNLVVSYQRSVDKEMVDLARETAQRDSFNLFLLYIVFIASGLFLFLNVRSNFKNYRIARIAIENERRRLEETIAELSLAQSRVSQLEDLDSAKNALISTVNHELRTPLTSIIGYIELMRRENIKVTDDEIKLYLEVLDRNAQLLLNLVESMLSLSKFDNAAGKLPKESVDLFSVIDNVLFTMKPALESAQISVDFQSEDNPTVRGDFGQLTQVFINLITNAVKFSPAHSRVRVSLKSNIENKMAEIVITDEGIGIPKEDITRIFARFFRASNVDSGQYQGSGLGLSIVERAISHHGGSITVDSTLGRGTTFSFTLPLYEEEKSNG